ncbi:MAG: hypothetical protein PHH28_07710 [Desulfuromonadaceae bacterium]|nr:hypothetical protein [Desulfuromonadaceae bacterium]
MTKLGFRSIETVNVIADGLIGSIFVGEGRPIPIIIIDATNQPDIAEYIDAHEFEPPGDVQVQWGTSPFDKRKISLIINSSRPVKTEFGINLDAVTEYSLIDAVLHAKGLYLQTGKPGDKIATRIDAPKILIEVPDTDFFKTWNKILNSVLVKKFKKEGLPKAKAVAAAEELIQSMRKVWGLRKNNA